jgi:mevalonate kinase
LRDLIPSLAVPSFLSNDLVTLRDFVKLVQGPLRAVFSASGPITKAVVDKGKHTHAALIPESVRSLNKPMQPEIKLILASIGQSQRVFDSPSTNLIADRFASIQLMLSNTNSIVHRPRLEHLVTVLKKQHKKGAKRSLNYIVVLLEQMVSLCWSSG